MIEKVRFVLLYLVLVTESVVQTHAAEPSDLAWARVKDADHWTEVVARAVTATTLPKIVPADISAFCPSYEQSSTTDRSHFRLAQGVTENTRRELERKTRIYCLSARNTDSGMWGLYAGLNGICLHFASHSGSVFGNARGVVYSPTREPILIPSDLTGISFGLNIRPLATCCPFLIDL